MTGNHLAFLLHPSSIDQPKLQRTLLRDQVIESLRDLIVSGKLPPSTKLIEREVAEWFGVSRAPARDALMQLEKEGLVESRSTGRYVIELTEADISELYQVRRSLERLAVKLAAQNACPENRAALALCLEAMHDARISQDRDRHVAADVEMHWLIWQQAKNEHLFRMLNSIVGPIFMFAANNINDSDWVQTFALHQALATSIGAGDVAAATKSLDLHMEDALQHSMQAFRRPKTTV